MEMETMQNEKDGLEPPSYTEEEPLMGSSAQSSKEKAWDALRNLFPQSSATDREASYSPKGNLQVKMAGAGKRLYKLFTKEKSTGIERINPQISKEIRKGLGPPAQEIIAQDNESIREERQRLKEAEKQLQEAEIINAQKEKEVQEVEDLRNRIERTQARIDQLGTNVENESEVRRLRQLKKNLQTDFENKKKEVAALEKQAKNIEKEKAKVVKLRAGLATKEKERNTLEERLNTTKSLDELDKRDAELKRQIEEDKLIINDEESSPSDKEAARDRVAEAEDERARLRPQIEVREEAMPTRERVKRVFKILGVTLASLTLATGIILSAIYSIISNNVLTAMGNGFKKMGNGLKEIGKKIAAILPGLIGSIASFLFKAAGRAIAFLAEHTWLLILAVVAFLVESYVKKQR